MVRLILALVCVLLSTVLRADTPPGSDPFGDLLPAGAVARLGTARLRCGGIVLSLEMSPDGKTIVSSEASGNAADGTNATGGPVRFWDAADGKEIGHLKGTVGGAVGQVRLLRFAANGATLATVDIEGSIALWDAKKDTLRKRFPAPVKAVRALAVAADGKSIFTGAATGEVREWHAATGLEARRFAGGKEPVRALSVTKTHLYALAQDGALRQWDLDTGKETRQLEVALAKAGRGMPLNVALSADGKWLAVPSRAIGAQAIDVWDVAKGVIVLPVAVAGATRLNGIALSRSGKKLAVSTQGKGGGIRLWDVPSGKEVGFLEVYSGMHVPMQFDDDDCWLIFAGFDFTIRRWDVRAAVEKKIESSHQGPLLGLALLPGGKHIVTGSADQTARVWELPSGKERGRFEQQGSTVSAVASLPDGSVLTGGYNGKLLQWSLVEGKAKRQRDFDDFPASIVTLAVATDGKTAAAGGRGLYLYTVATGKLLHQFSGSDFTTAVAFSPDSRLLAAASGLGPITLWDLHDYHVVRVIPGRFSTRGLAFARDGKAVFTADLDGHLWEVATGQERLPLKLGWGGGNSLALSPDGKVLAVGMTGTIVLYAADSGEQLGTLKGQLGQVRALAFTPDGLLLASAGSDATGLVWDMLPYRHQSPVKPRPLAENAAAVAWQRLAGKDAANAYQAMLSLIAGGDSSLALLREKLQPPPPDPEQLQKLIQALGSARFKERDEAQRKLEGLGDQAQAALAKAGQAPDLSVETRRRIEQLRQRLQTAYPERVQQLRALEVLERIGTASAREVLETISRNGPPSSLREEAGAALRRLPPPR